MTQRELKQFSISMFNNEGAITSIVCNFPDDLTDEQLRKLINDNVSYLIHAYSDQQITNIDIMCDRYD